MTFPRQYRLALAAMFALMSVVAFGADGDREGKLLEAAPPIYPPYCLRNKLQGHVDLVFTVDQNGVVKDPSVADVLVYRESISSPVADDEAKQAFERAALAALAKFKYEAPIRNGEAVVSADLRTRINFTFESEALDQ